MSFSSLGSSSLRPPEPTPAVFKKANVTVADGSANNPGKH